MNEEEFCSICADNLDDKYKHKLECGHEFHYECLLKSLKFQKKNICPICRKPFDFLPPVNGLKKLEYKIHYDYLNNDVLDSYKNVKCDHILTRGKNKGKKCDKNCKLGYFKCASHSK